MITKHVSLWYNIIYNMIKLLDNYLFYFAKICLKYTSSNMFWIVLLNKNLRTFWGWFVIKHPINKNSISLTSEIVCSYMRVFTVLTDLILIQYSYFFFCDSEKQSRRERCFTTKASKVRLACFEYPFLLFHFKYRFKPRGRSFFAQTRWRITP